MFELFNSNLTFGNDPTDLKSIKMNGQIDLNGTSSIQLANNLTSIDVNDLGVPVVGPDHAATGWKSRVYKFLDILFCYC